jgi:hypothetical protein
VEEDVDEVDEQSERHEAQEDVGDHVSFLLPGVTRVRSD